MRRLFGIAAAVVTGTALLFGGGLLGDAAIDVSLPLEGPAAITLVGGGTTATTIVAVPVLAPIASVAIDASEPQSVPDTVIGFVDTAVAVDLAGPVPDSEGGATTTTTIARHLERGNPVFVMPTPTAELGGVDAAVEQSAAAQRTLPRVTVADLIGPVFDQADARRAFVDACVLDAAGCPFGVPAVVLGPLESGPALSLAVTLAPDGGSRCTVGDPGPYDLPLLITTSRPADTWITYSLPPDDFGDIRQSGVTLAPPSQSEIDLWEQRADDGSELGVWPDGWVQQCVVLPGLVEALPLYTVETTAVDDHGAQVSTVVALQPPQFNGRDLPGVSFRSDNRMVLSIPTAPDEVAFVWPIEVREFPDTTCTDVETERLLGRTTPDFAHPDPLIAEAMFRSWRAIEAADGTRRFDYELPYREGRQYIVCGFVYRIAERSFDGIEVIDRYQYEVYTPNRFGVRVTVTELQVSAATPGVVVTPWVPDGAGIRSDACPGQTTAIGVQLDGPGAYRIDLPLCQSDGAEMPRRLPLMVTVTPPGGGSVSGVFAHLPIDASAGCETGRSDPGCVGQSQVAFFGRFLPIFPDCPECSIDGVARFRVDYLASTGEGAGNWVVGLEGTFTQGVGPDPNAGPPQIDTNGLRFAPIFDGVGRTLDIEFETNRPTTAAMTLSAGSAFPDCPDVAVAPTSLSTLHRARVTDLCTDVGYVLDVDLVDAESLTAHYPGSAFGWWAKPRALEQGILDVTITQITADPITAGERCTEMSATLVSAGGAPLAADCWIQLGFGHDDNRTRWYTYNGSFDTAADSFGHPCVTRAPADVSGYLGFRRDGFRQLTVTSEVHLTAACGGPDPLTPQDRTLRSLSRYGMITGSYQLDIAALLAADGPIILGTVDAEGLSFVIEATLRPFKESPRS